MKKIYLIFLSLLLSLSGYSQVNQYSFLQSNGIYQEIVGGTVLATATGAAYGTSFDSEVWDLPAGTIPFSFAFNNTTYTSCKVSSNGFITFGTTSPTTTSSVPISATTGYEGAISAWGKDINGAFDSSITSNISWKVEGVVPNREFVIQYKNVRPTASTSISAIYSMNFQIRLLENNNSIKIIYGNSGFITGTTINTSTVQIGLRGVNNLDYNNRTNSTTVNFNSSALGGGNSVTQAFSTDPNSVQGMPTNGLTYTYTPPACFFNENIITSSITQTGLTVNLSTAATFPIEIFVGTTPPTSTTVPSGTITSGSTSTSINGLTAALDYNIYIRYICPGSTLFTDWLHKNSFTTLCNESTGFYENFDNTSTGSSSNPSTPECWSYINDIGSTGYGYTNSSASDSRSTSNFFRFYRTNTTSNSSQTATLISPITTNLGNGTKQIRFYARTYSSSSTYDNSKLEVVRLDGNTSSSTTTVLATYMISGDVYKEYIVPLPQTTDDYFGFRIPHNGGTSNTYVYIDDVYYEDLEPCFFPTALDVSAVTQNSASISWTASIDSNVTAYEYEIRTSGLPGSGPVGLATSGTITAPVVTTNISGLNASTKYTVYIRSICGTFFGRWNPNSEDFYTSCGVVIGDIYENFDTTDIGSSSNLTVPYCWTSIDEVTSIGYNYVSSTYSVSSPRSYYMYKTNTSSNASESLYLISPETNNLGNGFKRLRFKVRATTTTVNANKLEILRGNGVTSSSTFTVIETIYPNQTNFVEYIINIPNTTDDYFGFRLAHNGGTTTSTIYIDDVYYEDIPIQELTIIKTDNICNGGNTGVASVVIEEGLEPFTYSWFPSGGNSHTATDLAAGTYTVTVTDALNRSETATVTITEPNNITSGLVYTDISCKGNNNGSATVNPTGGTGPYKILWSTNAITSTISGLLVGQYSVTITDANGCILTEDFSISEPNTLIASIGQQTDVSRYLGNDGSATVNITGGTAPYNYLWAPTGDTTDTASNLVAGTYSVLVTDANGCTANQTFVISQPIPLTINLVSKKDVTCKGLNNGEITVSLMGNHPPFTLNWAPIGGTSYTAANLTAGEYTLLVSNSIGETTTATFTITEPDALDVILGNTIDVTCFGGYNGSATANVIGGVAPYSFVWSNGESSATASNLTAGNHFVHITDANGCVIRKTFTIGQPSAIVISETINNISCNGQANGSVSITASGGTAPYTYSWNTGETSPSINNLSAGKYTLTITDAKNCFVSKTFNVVEPAFVYPPIAANQSFCVNAKLSDIIITGSNIKWYDDATNGNILPIGTNLVSGNVYYASQTINSCESSTRTAVQVTLFQPIPLTTVKIDVCNNTTIQDIVIDGNGFSQLRWYSNATSTTMLHYNHLLASGTYYVSTFTNNVCESIKYPIQVNVVAAVPAPIVGTQMVCGVKTFNDISINNVPGGIINWYSSVQSVTPLTGTDQILSGTYYIEQVVGSCKSGRVAVPVQVIPITSPNLTNITVCDGTTISELNNNLTSIKYIWYNDATTQTALNETQIIKAGTFYIAQEISGCISNRTKVDVVVNSRPNAPTGQQIQSFNFAATIFNLKMNQTGVEWYNSIQNANTLSNQLPSSTQLKDGETYYGIIRGVNGCPSYPTAVKVVVNLGFNELDLAYLKYYPNPIETELNIEYNEVIKGIEVYSITGQKVLNKEFNDKQIKVNLSGFSSGTYMVRIETEKASQFIKIVKR